WRAVFARYGEDQPGIDQRQLEPVGPALVADGAETVLLDQVEDRLRPLVLDIGRGAPDGFVERHVDQPGTGGARRHGRRPRRCGPPGMPDGAGASGYGKGREPAVWRKMPRVTSRPPRCSAGSRPSAHARRDPRPRPA